MRDFFWDAPVTELRALFGRHPEQRRLHPRVLVLILLSTVVFLAASTAVHIWDEGGWPTHRCRTQRSGRRPRWWRRARP
jgi:hypothetical protein